ncbi:hypothetical protein [Phaeodactylibacter sp.]|uniref:hypothetical protein n=1 Tax=Phaeodactylibacter sp. TaxID=1940289 RepID=UPI0025F01D10|nr:hypothetical protein [Phaeodactylibacter sp.]MCI4650870.1 hypothetical protein [Phaeodactylibacter sp.]MCI5089827.1 hypothetical protein [Phaeodactylibacter sp.]
MAAAEATGKAAVTGLDVLFTAINSKWFQWMVILILTIIFLRFLEKRWCQEI